MFGGSKQRKQLLAQLQGNSRAGERLAAARADDPPGAPRVQKPLGKLFRRFGIQSPRLVASMHPQVIPVSFAEVTLTDPDKVERSADGAYWIHWAALGPWAANANLGQTATFHAGLYRLWTSCLMMGGVSLYSQLQLIDASGAATSLIIAVNEMTAKYNGIPLYLNEGESLRWVGITAMGAGAEGRLSVHMLALGKD